MLCIDNSYFDLNDKLCELTEDEVKYFEDTVSIVKKALSVEIDIYSCNHEREHKGSKSKEALGSCLDEKISKAADRKSDTQVQGVCKNVKKEITK